MAAKIEREDIKDSFITILRLYDQTGKRAQELQVFVWEADAIETKVKNMTWATIQALSDTEGKRVIKGTA